MNNRKNLRVWAVWDNVINRVEYLSESRVDCEKIVKLFEKSGRRGLEILRFDLCPLYYEPSKSLASVLSQH